MNSCTAEYSNFATDLMQGYFSFLLISSKKANMKQSLKLVHIAKVTVKKHESRAVAENHTMLLCKLWYAQ